MGKRTLAVILACALAAALAAFPAGASARGHDHEWTQCGDQNQMGAGWYDVRAYQVRCRVARRTARYYWNSGGDSHFRGWRCDADQIGDEDWRADCTRELLGRHQHVRFRFGA